MAGRESRHLWVGGLPDHIGEEGIKEYFTKFGKIEGVKILPQRYPNLGVAAFIDFFDVMSAIEAKEAKHKIQGCELRTNYKSKPVEKFERRESGKWQETTGVDLEKPEKPRAQESSTSSSHSDSNSSSSSSSESSDSEQEDKDKKKSKKKAIDSLLLKVTGLAAKPERVLQDGLYYEFTRHSPNVLIRMYGDPSDKLYAIVKFKKVEECREVHKKSQGMVLFGSKIKLTPLEKDDFPSGGRDAPFIPGRPVGQGQPPVEAEMDPQATRSLFVGNIPKNIGVFELRDIFQRYGNVLDVEIKKMSGSATYGFVLFYDLNNAVTAKQYMDGMTIRGNNIRVGFGKGTASKTLWVDGIDPNMAESLLERHMNKYGQVVRLGIDRQRGCAMVQYDSMEGAKEALNSVKGIFLGNSRRLMTDFANRDARAAFFTRVETGEPPRGFPPAGPGDMYNPNMGPRGGGMMMPRPGMHMMGMGRGFPPPGHGPPLDYFYPYMDEGGYYGRPPFHGPGPMGMRRMHGHGPYEEGYDDYEDELMAFTRKREWEREREKRTQHRKKHASSSESEESDSEGSSSRRRKKSREKDKHKKKRDKKEKSEVKSEGEANSDEESGKMEEARIKATQKSRDHREKLKKKGGRKRGKSDDGEASSDSENEERSEAKKSFRKGKEREKENDRVKEKQREKSKSSSRREKDDSKVPKKKRTGTPTTPPEPPPPSKEKSPESVPVELNEAEKVREKMDGEDSAKENGHKGKTRSTSPPDQPQNVEPQTESPVEPEVEEEVEGKEQVEAPMEEGSTAEVPDTPQSPPLPAKGETKHVHERLESDLSSGEDFRDSEAEPMEAKKPPEVKMQQVEKEVAAESSNHEVDIPLKEKAKEKRRIVEGKKRAHSPKPRSPESEPSGGEGKTPPQPAPRRKPLPSGEDSEGKASDSEAGRRSRKLPRRYQLEEEERKEKYREAKEQRHLKRPHPPPTTPSPPPAFVSHRRRHYHSPPPPEYFERRWHRRGRAYSPPPYGHQRYSRSPPPGYPVSPPYPPRSPFSGSPPPRPRTPIQRPGRERGVPRHRFESPPYDAPRGKYSRRGSPPSPYHRHYSPSPRRSHSPRRYPRYRSHTPSPPRRSPIRRRERSRSSESGRGSPHHPEPKRRGGKRPGYSRTPSPRGKHRELPKEDHLEPKRRRIEEPRPKSPSATPPPPKEERKPSKMEKAHPPALPPPSSQGYRAESQRRGSAEKGPYVQQQQPIPPPKMAISAQQAQHYHHGGAEHARQTQPPTQAVPHSHAHPPPPNVQQQQTDNLLELLRRYPVMWQGHLTLKNDSAAVQLHFLSGNLNLAKLSLPQPAEQRTPSLRIAQRMRLEQTQLEGVERRIQNDGEHCLLLALPCGRDANDVRVQTHALKNNLISYLIQKQAAGIINVQVAQTGFVLHIFPPCSFSQNHLSRVAPDLLSSASDNCHLMIVVATM